MLSELVPGRLRGNGMYAKQAMYRQIEMDVSPQAKELETNEPKSKVKVWLMEQQEKVKSLDVRLAIQILGFAVIIFGIIFQSGRIIEETKQTKNQLEQLINANEAKRDLKDEVKALDVSTLKAKLDQEIADRKEDKKEWMRIKELYLVKFGQPIPAFDK